MPEGRSSRVLWFNLLPEKCIPSRKNYSFLKEVFKKSVIVCAVWLIPYDQNGVIQARVSRDFTSPASETPSSFICFPPLKEE